MVVFHGRCNSLDSPENAIFWKPKGSFTLLRSRAERSKDRNKATAVTPKLQCSNALICFIEHTLKHIENKALLRYATQKCERVFIVLNQQVTSNV